MNRTHLLSTAALASALLAAAPAIAQRSMGDAPPAGPMPHTRSAAEADRMQRRDGTDGGPAELLRRAQSAMRNGQAAQANELLERAETRLLTGVEPAKPVQGEPAFHVSEARRALAGRDRAEAMRHTNLAIATARDGGATATGSDAAGGNRGVEGGGPGPVDSGMGAVSGNGRAVMRDGGTVGTSVNRAEGIHLAQSDTGGRRGPPTGLPPGDSIPGWSGPRSGAGGTAPQQGLAPTPAPPPLGSSSTGTPPPGSGLPGINSGPSSSGMIGGEPARAGGAPPGDTSRSPGSSGIGGAGVGGPLR